jgi:DNA-binding HxlR family transcriptional regulator
MNNKTFTCPVDVTLSRVGGKWKILILAHLHQVGKKSFSDIRKNLPGISEKMLNQQLKELQRDSLIEKNVLSIKPYRVEFFLTASGQSLSPLYDFLSKWGIDFLKQHNIDYFKDQDLYK